jgi:hypothetical protein
MTFVATDMRVGWAATAVTLTTPTGTGLLMFPDAEILRRRASACARLPWVLPATLLLEITDADVDALASTPDEEYWTVLKRITFRITSDGGRTRDED